MSYQIKHMRDVPTQYFRRYEDSYDDNYSSSSSDYYYDGGYNYNGYQSQYGQYPSDSRRYDNRRDPKYVPPYEPQTYNRPQYPQTYHDPYVNAYDYYDYQRTYQREPYPYQPSPYQAPPNTERIPPYEPTAPAPDSRRNDKVGLLNSDLYASYQGYSKPIAQRYERKYAPPVNTVYSKANPVVGGVCNNYTRPPVPRNPQIDWDSCLSKDKREQQQPYEYDYVCVGSAYDQSQYVHAAPEVPEETWEEIAKRNFASADL